MKRAHVGRVNDFWRHPMPSTGHCGATLVVRRENGAHTKIGQLDMTLQKKRSNLCVSNRIETVPLMYIRVVENVAALHVTVDELRRVVMQEGQTADSLSQNTGNHALILT